MKIDIIKHPNETDGKSTAVHAKLLAPEFVNIYTYPCIPEYEEKDHEVGSLFFFFLQLFTMNLNMNFKLPCLSKLT